MKPFFPTSGVPRRPESVLAEVSAVSEILALPLAGTLEELSQELGERVPRVLGARRFAVVLERGTARRALILWGFRDEQDVQPRAARPGPECVSQVFGLFPDARGVVFAEHARPLEESQRRLYAIIAARIRDELQVILAREEHERAEARIRQLNRLLRTITLINQWVVREEDPQRILTGACQVLVEDAGFRMAWVGMADRASGRVRPVAWAGHVAGYLEEVSVRCDESPEGREVAGAAIRTGAHVVVPDVDAGADSDPWRAAARRCGYRCAAAFPLVVRGEVVGALTVYAWEAGAIGEEEVGLLEELARDLSYALEVARVREERREAEAALRKRLHYEQLVGRITAAAAQVGDLNRFQQDAIRMLGEGLDVSRVYIFEHRHATDTMDNTFEWCAAGITPQKDNLQGLPSSMAPWWVQTLQAGRPIRYADIEEIPDEGVKQILRPQAIVSILVVPLFVAGRYYGFLGFDECRQRRDWPPEDVDLLWTVARVVAGTIERAQVWEALRKEHREMLTLFDSLDDVIYVADMDTHEILFANRRTKRLFGKELVGGLCYREFQRRESPCPFCTNERIRAMGGEPYRWEYHNPVLNRTFEITDRVIRWPDGREVRFELAHDVTERKRAEQKVQEQLNELRRWYEVTLGREERIAELKQEVNALLARLGENPRYGPDAEG